MVELGHVVIEQPLILNQASTLGGIILSSFEYLLFTRFERLLIGLVAGKLKE
jgi:hypothetical protein